MRVRQTLDHLFRMHASICLYFSSPQDKYASDVVTQPMITLTVRCCYQLVIDGQPVLPAWNSTVGQEAEDGGGVMLGLCTCSSRQLQWGLCVVLHPVLQGPLHVGFGIQQQLWKVRWGHGGSQERETEVDTGRVSRLMSQI